MCEAPQKKRWCSGKLGDRRCSTANVVVCVTWRSRKGGGPVGLLGFAAYKFSSTSTSSTQAHVQVLHIVVHKHKHNIYTSTNKSTDTSTSSTQAQAQIQHSNPPHQPSAHCPVERSCQDLPFLESSVGQHSYSIHS